MEIDEFDLDLRLGELSTGPGNPQRAKADDELFPPDQQITEHVVCNTESCQETCDPTCPVCETQFGFATCHSCEGMNTCGGATCEGSCDCGSGEPTCGEGTCQTCAGETCEGTCVTCAGFTCEGTCGEETCNTCAGETCEGTCDTCPVTACGDTCPATACGETCATCEGHTCLFTCNPPENCMIV